MARLSVNINKIATLRNARGGNIPDLIEAAIKIQEFGADGITVHPRPDERHIRYTDVHELKKAVTTEFNIEGYPSEIFLCLAEEILPQQVTLVPDLPDALTSNAGWDVKDHLTFLKETVARLQSKGMRVSLFMDTGLKQIEFAAQTGANRIELYTERYAKNYNTNPSVAIAGYIEAANIANELQLGLNAGHDLNLENLSYFSQHIPGLLEVSIGHALICDALYYGLHNTVQMYKHELNKKI